MSVKSTAKSQWPEEQRNDTLFYLFFIFFILCKSILQFRKNSQNEIFEKIQCENVQENFMKFYICSVGIRRIHAGRPILYSLHACSFYLSIIQH